MGAVIHYDPPDVIPGKHQNVRACDHNKSIAWDAISGDSGTGSVSAVTCPKCKETDEFKASLKALDGNIAGSDVVHYHDSSLHAAGDRRWACGSTSNSQATGEPHQVTCDKCKSTESFKAEVERRTPKKVEVETDVRSNTTSEANTTAEEEVLPLSESEVPGEGDGTVLGGGVGEEPGGVPAVRDRGEDGD